MNSGRRPIREIVCRRDNLGVIYSSLGQYDKALAEAREALRLDPASGQSYANLVAAYLSLNRLEEARATAEEAQAKNLDSPYLHFVLYLLAFLQNDAAGMAQQVAWAAGKPGVEDVLLSSKRIQPPIPGGWGRLGSFPARRWLPPSGQKKRKRRQAMKPTRPCGKPSSAMPPRPGSEPPRRSPFRRAAMCSMERRWRWPWQGMRPGRKTGG